MKKNKLIAPVLKWVGGKRQLIETFLELIPEKIYSYCEPFLGGGALFFELQPKKAYVNDINADLILVYLRRAVKVMKRLKKTCLI